MSPGAELIDDGLRELEDAQGNPTFVYRGRHWACSGNLIASDLMLEPGGKKQDLVAAITIRKTALKPIRTADQSEGETADSESETADADVMPPHQGKLCIFKNIRFRIGRMIGETEAAWKIELVSPHLR
jgi:hypothetical protein